MTPAAPYDPWRDVNGVPVREGAQVEHVGGVVVGCIETGYGRKRLLVRFGSGEEYAIHPRMVRVVPPTLRRIVGDLHSLLRDLARRPDTR